MPSQEDYLDKLLQGIGEDEESENGESQGVSETPDTVQAAEELQDAVDTLPADTMADLEAALGSDGNLDMSSLLELSDEPAPETEYEPDPVSESGAEDGLLEDAVAVLEAVLDNEESLETDGGGFVETELEEAVIADLEAAAEEAAEEPVLEEAVIEEPSLEEFEEAAAEEPAMEEFEEAAITELEDAAVEAVGEPALGEPVLEEFEEAAVDEPAIEELEEDVIAELEDAAVEAVGEPALGEPVLEEFEEAAVDEPAIEEPAIEELEEDVIAELEDAAVEAAGESGLGEFDLNKMVENLDETTAEDILKEMASQSEEAELEAIPEGTASIVESTYEEEPAAEAEVLDSDADDNDEISLDDLLAQEAETAQSEMEEPVMDEESDGLADLMGEDAPDLDAVSSMSEDEIDRLLAAGAQEAVEAETVPEEEQADLSDDEDILGMLEDTDDSELQEIQDMLQKADNNEAVDEEIEALLQEPAEEENLAEKLLTEEDEEQPDEIDAKTQKSQEKEQKRQEKAEAKKAKAAAKAAAKEAKAAAKAAAKEAKAAAKAGAAVAGAAAAVADAAAVAGAGAALAENADTEPETGVDDKFDTSVLDAIVLEADKAGMDDGQSATEEGDIMADTDNETFGGNDSDIDASDLMQENDGEAGDDDLDFDMESLFGNDAGDSSFGTDSDAADDAAELQNSDSDFPDFVALDGDNVDSIMPEEESEGKKKKGLLARLLDFLTEEDEEDEESSSLQLSEENKDILNQLDNEKTSGKKKKKKKGADEEDGKDKKEKAAKPKKEKKPKPEKPKKEKVVEPGPLIPERKLTLKRVMPIVLVCLSLGVLIMVFSNATVDYNTRKNARDAYYAGDYQACFQNLYGKENLSETEQIMFGTSESILRMQLWLKEYDMFVEEGAEIEALDCLIQTVHDYPELYEYAVQWNAGDEVMVGYALILNILNDKYGLTEEQALEIAAVHSDREYTRRIVMVILGGGNGSGDASVSTTPPEEAEPTPLPDVLPEEGELENNSFIDNH